MNSKPIIDYNYSTLQMGDLIASEGVSIKKDFSEAEREQLAKCLEDYMSSEHAMDEFKIDLKKFYLVIKGPDEASHLYQYFK